jgi:hypothetical protein
VTHSLVRSICITNIEFYHTPVLFCFISYFQRTQEWERRGKQERERERERNREREAHTMDDYPAADPIPDPVEGYDARYTTLMEFLSTSKEMKQTATSSFKQAMYAGSGAMAGGMIFGPLGGLIGGVAGSLIGYVKSSDYDGAMVHLCKLDPTSKKELLTRVGQVLVAAGAATKGIDTNINFRDTLLTYASQQGVRDSLWNACLDSLHE